MKFLYRIGVHRNYLDAAMFHSVEVCDICGRPSDPVAHKQLQRECTLWAEAPGVSFSEKLVYMIDKLYAKP